MSVPPSEISLILQNIDNLIENHLEERDAEKSLTRIYNDFMAGLKTKVGTSTGFTGLSEYLFFRFILRSIEKKLGIEFDTPNDENKDTFRSGRIMLTHDVNIHRIIRNIEPQKTDIAIFLRDGEKYKLIAGFQEKIYFSSPNQREDDIKKLKDILKKTDALVFEIVLNTVTGKDEERLQEFCKGTDFLGRAFVISTNEIGSNKKIGDAIDMIVNKIKKDSPL